MFLCDFWVLDGFGVLGFGDLSGFGTWFVLCVLVCGLIVSEFR